MKNKTNRQVMKKAIETLNDFTLAVLRERILMITEATLADKEAVKKQMANSFFHPDAWLEHIEQIHNAFKFEEEAKPRDSVVANALCTAYEGTK